MLGPFKRRSPSKPTSGKSDMSVRELMALLTSQHEDLLEQLRPGSAAERAMLPPLPSVLRQIAHGKPVVVGPWRGEVGWEVLYWIPFLRWLRERGLSPERTIAISRGGPRSWYSEIADRYVDVSELPDDFRDRSIDDGTQKQRTIDPNDAAAARHVAQEHRLKRFVHLHPAVMYRMMQPYWTGVAPSAYVHRLTAVRPLTPPPLPDDLQLPERFVVVKFYDSHAFPLRDGTVAWARQVLGALADEIDLVLLNPALPSDDHAPLTIDVSSRVHTIDPSRWKDRNLDVQTAIVSRASGLIATYGGFSYLGPLLGVPTISVYANADAVLGHHLELAREMFDRLAPGLYTALHMQHFEMLRLNFK
jgi:hypothetical protein